MSRQPISKYATCQKFDSISTRSSPLPTNGTSEIRSKLQKSKKLTAKFPVEISKSWITHSFLLPPHFLPYFSPISGPHSSERLIQAALLFPWQHCHGNCRVHFLSSPLSPSFLRNSSNLFLHKSIRGTSKGRRLLHRSLKSREG